MSKPKVEAIANYHCKTGENPYWDVSRQRVIWTDIPNGRLFEYDLQTKKHRQIYSGEQVGGFTLQADGALLLFGVNKISRMTPDGKVTCLVDGIDDRMGRFNDVIADPEGRVYAGTSDTTFENGGVYRVERDGSVSCLFRGTACSNGMGFSPDLRSFYWTCSTQKKITLFDYDRASGELSNRRLFLDLSKEPGTPDGLTVDTDGDIWSARWDGFAVYRYSPRGEFREKIELPVGKVSSVTFGGPDLHDLYLTTAGGTDGSQAADGTLYRIRVPQKGVAEFQSRVML